MFGGTYHLILDSHWIRYQISPSIPLEYVKSFQRWYLWPEKKNVRVHIDWVPYEEITWDLVKNLVGIRARTDVEVPPKPRSMRNSAGSTFLDINTLSTLELRKVVIDRTMKIWFGRTSTPNQNRNYRTSTEPNRTTFKWNRPWKLIFWGSFPKDRKSNTRRMISNPLFHWSQPKY